MMLVATRSCNGDHIKQGCLVALIGLISFKIRATIEFEFEPEPNGGRLSRDGISHIGRREFGPHFQTHIPTSDTVGHARRHMVDRIAAVCGFDACCSFPFGLQEERLADRIVGACMEIKSLDVLTGCGENRQITTHADQA
ncbi:hypothetical protein FSARC_16 [Fusarium sarcochroum]|uniref:Uncharacterized protein n=1 Tax=Fusarium sarcochroum TaxID=1208366 RepID=A0A8H4UD63_9HYPO|nr:hypothetical protein FSARC_16 [Fusarium sarcochroum]